ncbi:hypothetical protein JOQ06_013693, partial [Pogonophryne albipinna]
MDKGALLMLLCLQAFLLITTIPSSEAAALLREDLTPPDRLVDLTALERLKIRRPKRDRPGCSGRAVCMFRQDPNPPQLVSLGKHTKATSAGLKYMVQQENRPLSYLTTAWFLEQVDRWFDRMSSRHPITALSRLKMEEYQKAITVLQNIVHLFCGIKIVEFHHALRIISVGQFLTTISSVSYQEDH